MVSWYLLHGVNPAEQVAVWKYLIEFIGLDLFTTGRRAGIKYEIVGRRYTHRQIKKDEFTQ
jgi:hypothetical protein